MSSIIKLYHASDTVIKAPIWNKGQIDTDFGQGFYLTPDLIMAEKWACRKKPSVINEYLMDIRRLSVYRFEDNEEWLDFVVNNRQLNEMDTLYSNFDLLVGPTADDKLFSTVEQYEMGLLSSKAAARVLDCMKIGVQYVCKTSRAVQSLVFEDAYTMNKTEKDRIKQIIRNDRDEAARLTRTIIQEEVRKQNRENEIER